MTHDVVTRVLIAARKRITDPRHWTRKVLARDAQRYECPAPLPMAVRWCAVGALQAECATVSPTAYGWHVSLDEPLLAACRDRLEQAIGWSDVPGVNDRKGHAAVLAMYDAAIRGK